MFETEKHLIEKEIRSFCQAQGLPASFDLHWTQLPFAGEWGISTSLFQLAANEARRSATKLNVSQRAAELASSLAQHLGTPPGFARVEAVKGYLNLYFSAPSYAARVLAEVTTAGDKYGWGAPKNQRVMLEFSQPNTHKAFHVGHLRNMILGAALANILEASGYEVENAGDAAQALRAIESTSFDLLISDLGLPDGSGLDLMKALRERGSTLKSIALSGYGREEDIRRSKEAGFSAHLTKPVDAVALIEAVEKIV